MIPNQSKAGFRIYNPEAPKSTIPETEVGFNGGFKHGAIGTKMAFLDDDTVTMDNIGTYKPTKEEIDKVYKAFNYRVAPSRLVLDNLSKPEDIDRNIAIVKGNQDYALAVSQAGGWDSFKSSVGETFSDPISLASMFVSPGTTIPKAVAVGAISSGLSAAYSEEATGVEQDVMTQGAVGGALAGAISGITHGLAKIKAKASGNPKAGATDEALATELENVAREIDYRSNKFYQLPYERPYVDIRPPEEIPLNYRRLEYDDVIEGEAREQTRYAPVIRKPFNVGEKAPEGKLAEPLKEEPTGGFREEPKGDFKEEPTGDFTEEPKAEPPGGGTVPPPEPPYTPFNTEPKKGIFTDALKAINKKMPGINLGDFISRRVKGKEFKEFLGREFKWQEGQRAYSADLGRDVFQQVDPHNITAEEIIGIDATKQRYWRDKYSEALAYVKSHGGTVEDLEDAIARNAEGEFWPEPGSFMADPKIKELADGILKYYEGIHYVQVTNGLNVGKYANYIPRMIDFNKVNRWADSLFPDKKSGESLRLLRAKGENLLLSGLSKPKVYQRMFEFYKDTVWQPKADALAKKGQKLAEPTNEEFMEWARKQAKEDMFGYVDQNRSNVADGYSSGKMSNYRQRRTPWDFTVTDADGFSLNKLQSDTLQTMGRYGRRAYGDIISVAKLGIDPHEVNIYDALRKKLNGMCIDEAKAYHTASEFDKAKKELIYGTTAWQNAIYRTTDREFDLNNSWADAVLDSIMDLTFATKNMWMGPLNLTESAEAIKAYGATFALKSLPGVRRLFADWSQGKLDFNTRREFTNLAFGYSTRGLRCWDDIASTMSDKYGAETWKAKLTTGTKWLAEISPFTRYLNATQESIANTARDLFLGELMDAIETHPMKFFRDAKNGKGFLNATTLARAGVSKEDYAYMCKVLQQTFKNRELINPNNPAILGDAKALMTLRRLGNYVSSECIQENSMENIMLWQGAKRSAVMSLLLQFKSFAIASYQNRLLKNINRWQEGDKVGVALTTIIGTTLAGLGIMAQDTLTISGMNDEQRKKYLKARYGIEKMSDADFGTYMRFLFNAGLRSGIFAAPALLMSFAGVGTGYKSTAQTTNENPFLGAFELGKLTPEELAQANIPAWSTARTLGNLITDGANSINYSLRDKNNPETAKKLLMYRKGFNRDVMDLLSTNVNPLKTVIKNKLDEEAEASAYPYKYRIK